MTGATIGIALMAVLFLVFGLLRRGTRGGEACETCAGGCSTCVELTRGDRMEVNRVRK